MNLNKKRKNIGIIGLGYVGKAMTHFFSGKHSLVIHDIDIKNIIDFNNEFKIPDLIWGMNEELSKQFINDCDLSVICVPTPMKEDGTCDISIVEEVIKWVDTPLSKKYNKEIVFSPEYCGESAYWTPYAFHTDIKETPFFIFGGPKDKCKKMIQIFEPITGPTKTYRTTSSTEAELTKYMENTFYATKIAFCYEIAEICEKLNIDYEEVRSLFVLDPRVNPMHTSVFDTNDKPFGGKCFPKDLNGLINKAKELGYEPKLLEEVWQTNLRIEKLREDRR